jgi:hypothetical protein
MPYSSENGKTGRLRGGRKRIGTRSKISDSRRLSDRVDTARETDFKMGYKLLTNVVVLIYVFPHFFPHQFFVTKHCRLFLMILLYFTKLGILIQLPSSAS